MCDLTPKTTIPHYFPSGIDTQCLFYSLLQCFANLNQVALILSSPMGCANCALATSAVDMHRFKLLEPPTAVIINVIFTLIISNACLGV